jgi:hypothetical protein
MSRYIALAVLGLIIATGVGSADQGSARLVTQPPNVRFAEAWRPIAGRGATQIVGAVVDIRQVPVANALVQLRNLATGEVTQEGITNEQGEYAFTVEEPGVYIVEVVGGAGQVVALSNAGALARFETLQTLVQLPGRWDSASRTIVWSPNVTNFVGMSAAHTMTAATLTLAIAMDVTPVDPGEAVSP